MDAYRIVCRVAACSDLPSKHPLNTPLFNQINKEMTMISGKTVFAACMAAASVFGAGADTVAYTNAGGPSSAVSIPTQKSNP